MWSFESNNLEQRKIIKVISHLQKHKIEYTSGGYIRRYCTTNCTMKYFDNLSFSWNIRKVSSLWEHVVKREIIVHVILGIFISIDKVIIYNNYNL